MLRFLAAAASALCVSFSMASAAGELHAPPEFSPMQFSIVRSAAAGCEPDCPEWIFAEGQIVGTSPAGLKRILKMAGKRRLPILIQSPGGDVDAAMAMGRLIRERKLDTGVSGTRFAGCRPADPGCKLPADARGVYTGAAFSGGAFCVSACPLMLAGGIERLASHWSYVGVHQVTVAYSWTKVVYKTRYRIVDGRRQVLNKVVSSRQRGPVHKTTTLGKPMRKRLLGYLAEMGIAPSTLDAMLSTPPEDMRHLPEDELLRLGLITRLGTADMLVASSLCRRAAPAGNCVTAASLSKIPLPMTAPRR